MMILGCFHGGICVWDWVEFENYEIHFHILGYWMLVNQPTGANNVIPSRISFRFETHWVLSALTPAFPNAGSSIAASMAIIAMTTCTSMSGKPDKEPLNDEVLDE